MAVRRTSNVLSQQRWDVSNMRSLESAVQNDFDELLNSLVIGESKSYVLRGFDLEMSGAIGSAANSLQLIVSEGSILHGNSNEAGTFFVVPAGTANEIINSTTNTRVDGSFTPGTLNYIGLEFTRQVDDTTNGQVFFWNPTTESEISKTVPLALTFDFKIVVTSSIWSANVLPISVVETDASNNVVKIQDRRPMLFRLGTGGTGTPDPSHTYPWNNHTEGRVENFWESTTSTSPFRGGDKQIENLKEWMDAVMSTLLEVKGTAYWYSSSPAGSTTKLRLDLANTQLTGSGKFTHSSTTPGQMNWSSDLYLNNISSRLEYKILVNAATTDITLADEQVAYVKLVRNIDIVPQLIFTNGSAIVSSVGAVSWTSDVLANDFIKIKHEDETKYYKILSVDSASQVTLTEVFGETSDTTAAQYAWGTYQTDAAPSTDRHLKVANRKDVPFGDDYYWIFYRSDKGGAAARVYLRGASGGEIEQGETRDISDNQTDEVLDYIGSPSEVDTTPDYTNAIVTAVAEITTFTLPPAADITTGQYFNLNAANDYQKYYVWFNKDAGGGDPHVPGRIGIEATISTGDAATVVATEVDTVVGALGDFNSTDNLDGTVTITNSKVGATTNATNGDVGGAFAIVVDTQGVGNFNHFVLDDENLTRSIKRLDEKLGDLDEILDQEAYAEEILVVSGAPASDNEITGPVAATTVIILPLNSRDGNVQQVYTVGSGELKVYHNGMLLGEGRDYSEVGVAGTESYQIQTLINIPVDWIISFEIDSNATLSGGGGSTITASNLGTASDADVFKQLAGNDLQFRRLTAGSGITITEGVNDISFTAVASVAPSSITNVSGTNYVATTADDVILVANSGTDVTITLPSATSSGKVFNIKKIDAGNNLFIKSIGGQTLDGVDIDATPEQISTQYQSLTIVADGSNWWVI